jgi:hypothetical protein
MMTLQTIQTPKHGRHRQFLFQIGRFLKIFFSVSEIALPNELKFGGKHPEKKIFRNQPIRNKNCLWQPYLLMDRDK